MTIGPKKNLTRVESHSALGYLTACLHSWTTVNEVMLAVKWEVQAENQ